ncbi:MAG: cysteine hydrolase [Sphingomonas bacterium]|nr:cysteine hydrolase [Sphingomonas bacterium]MDB5684188.1 cysteine hydrolase [Sphingomonas bacterium]MDB5716606.1 cysteine hydrolase [Sphingomonas bacterium]
MHAVDHAGIVDRIAAGRGGVRHVLTTIDPARTAHLVIDLQNGFLEPGALVEVPAARGIVANVNRVSRALRAAGGLNVFLRFTTADDPADWAVMKRRGGAGAAAHAETFKRGAHGWALWPELDVGEGDLMVDKLRFGAFIPGTCDLDQMLRARGIDTLIITGTLSNCCCESTARDAMQLDYNVIFVPDANAAPSDAEHATTLANMGWLFADLYATDEVVALIAG